MLISSTVPVFTLRRLVLKATVVLTLVASAAALAQSNLKARIVTPVSNEVRATLSGSTPPLVSRSRDLGVLADSTPADRMLLVLKRSDEQQVKLEQTLSDLQNPKSSTYHHWLTPENFSRKFGISDADLQSVNAWLQSQGFNVSKVSKGRAAIEFSGSVGQVRSAFHTELHRYTAPDGTSFNANSADPQIPAALAPVVGGLAALNNIPSPSLSRVLGHASFNPRTHEAKPLHPADWTYPVATGGVQLVVAPGDLAVQYNINPLYSAGNKGDGVTIGVVSQAGIDESTVTNYRKLFGLSTTNLPKQIIDGFDPGTDGDGAGVEADLDVEVAGSTAPNASIYVYTSYDTQLSFGLFNASIRAVDDDIADILNVSYGICEPTLGVAGNLLFNQLWSQAAAQGQTVIVSSGDSGGAGCDNGAGSATHGLSVNGITSTPYNLSVGGTDFYYAPYGSSNVNAIVGGYWNLSGTAAPATSLLKPIPEQPWNNAFGLNIAGAPTTGTTGGGSGGPSSCVSGVSGPPSSPYIDSFTSCTAGTPKPAWQSAPGVPQDGVRDIPDISLFAANGYNFSYYPICSVAGDCEASTADPTTGAYQITGVGGTSAAAPLMSGILALIEQSQHGRQGNINPILYSLAKSTPAVFHDVTVGSNNTNCTQGTPDCALDANGFYSYSKYSAGKGYDLASGLGSIDANALLTNWTKPSFTPTTTSLAASSTAFAHGTSVTLTSVVSGSSGTPTGAVAIVAVGSGATQTGYGTMTLTNGTAQATFSSLPAGTYQLYAIYSGDTSFAASTSDPVTMTVAPENSTVSVTGKYFSLTSTGDNGPVIPITDNLSATYGGAFDIDARVFGASSNGSNTGGIPTGSITVMDNGSTTTVLSLSNGSVELQTASMAPGKHALTFVYSGDTSFSAGTSQPLNINITKGVPQILLSFSLPSGLPAGGTVAIPVEVTTAYGQLPLGGSITVTLGSQTQTITNLQQSNFAGLSSIGYGSATFDLSAVGTFNLDASYSGDTNLNPVAHAFNPSTLTVYSNALPISKTALTMSADSIGPNGTITANIKVTGGSAVPTGFVSLTQNGNLLGSTVLLALDATGSVSAVIPAAGILGNGNLQFQASYGGDNFHTPSLSNVQTVAANVGEFSLTTTQAAMQMTAGSSGNVLVAVGAPYGQRLSGAVNLSCSTSSAVLECSFAQNSLMLSADPVAVASTTLTITSKAATTADSAIQRRTTYFASLAGGSALLAVCFLLPGNRRRRIPALLAVLLVSIASLSATGCGSSVTIAHEAPVGQSPSANAGPYTVTVTGTSSGVTKSVTVRVVLK